MPTSSEGFFNLGLLQREMGGASAERCYKTAVRLLPGSARFRYSFGNLLYDHNRCGSTVREHILQYQSFVRRQPVRHLHICTHMHVFHTTTTGAAPLNRALDLTPSALHPQPTTLKPPLYSIENTFYREHILQYYNPETPALKPKPSTPSPKP